MSTTEELLQVVGHIRLGRDQISVPGYNDRLPVGEFLTIHIGYDSCFSGNEQFRERFICGWSRLCGFESDHLEVGCEVGDRLNRPTESQIHGYSGAGVFRKYELVDAVGLVVRSGLAMESGDSSD